MSSTFYLDQIKVTRKNPQTHEIVGVWQGYHIHPNTDSNGHVLIDHRVISYDEMKRRLSGLEIDVVKSTKLQPVYSTLRITNGRNNELGVIDTKNLNFRSKTSFSNYEKTTELSEIIARSLLSSIHNDIKVYKLDGIEVMRF